LQERDVELERGLVIVESPTKARTIGRILGRKFTVMASFGHVRDLPTTRMGVEVADDITPEYLVPRGSRRLVSEISELAKQAPITYLATDPDREGEAISWHLARAAGIPHDRLKRVVFHEITAEAVELAFQSPRDIDMNLVNAQQARRIMDRLVGYSLSPLISKKLRWWGLSAGRVQSVALRLVVERELEIEAFIAQEYWSIDAQLGSGELKSSSSHADFVARLMGKGTERKNFVIPSSSDAQEICADLEGAVWAVKKINVRDVNHRPPPPFITSTLQQEAGSKLRFGARRTMTVAQQLYEGVTVSGQEPVGLITYMRTDSTNVAQSAVQEAREYLVKMWGKDYIPPRPRVHRKKVKGAQEAHEAIRPTSILRTPEKVKSYLNREQSLLYELIWKRFLASQMADAKGQGTTIQISALSAISGTDYQFQVSGEVIVFPGFRKVYLVSSDDTDRKPEHRVPEGLSTGTMLQCLGLNPVQHFTQPSPRFSEASLVAALERQGIGRPSTYAAIVSTVQERGYVSRDRGRLLPLPLGRVVNQLLTEHFSSLVDLGFTAQMEEELDQVAQGERDWQGLLQSFYEPFAHDLDDASSRIPPTSIPVSDQQCEVCEKSMVLKRNRWGRTFLSCIDYPDCRHARPLSARVAGECPRCGGKLVERKARKGRRSTFYGCANYPSCDFTINQRPLGEPCPECGGLLVRKGKNDARCVVCVFTGRVTVESENSVT